MSFILENYYSYLKTLSLGRPCIFVEQTESTIIEAFDQPNGTVVVAGQQTKGRGQRDNVWFSPKGCAMASLKLTCAKTSFLGNRISFLQHIVGLSILRALETIDRDKLGKSNIKLKWPNDIIYTTNKDQPKIGGILVNSQDSGNLFAIVVSFGLNIFNKEPTTCLSNITQKTNLSIEQVVAQVFNNFEDYIYELNDTKFNLIKHEYIERCLYSKNIVEDEINGSVRVTNIDDDGFLVGERVQDKKSCTVTNIFKPRQVATS